mmetsp:Transcript_7881/g.13049  ORF Transcript_7881/g.13049 Transcript_7881/m.13049 type:complete len:189 (-) Transcript_7881:257-823(-)
MIRASIGTFVRRSNLILPRMISVGQPTPSGVVDILDPSADYKLLGENTAKDFGEVLKTQKKVVLFALPGAFTPVCSEKHLPGFMAKAGELRAKGVEDIYCLSVNDWFVMRAWGKSYDGFKEAGIKLVCDGNGDYTRAIGCETDLSVARLGQRCSRFAAIVENGVFKTIDVDASSEVDKSGADSILAQL